LNNVIRKIDTQGIITTFVAMPNNNNAVGVALGPDGTMYMSTYNQIFHISSSGKISVIAGGQQSGYGGDNGPATSALLNCSGILVDKTGNVYIADSGNSRIRRIDTSGTITTIAGNGQQGPASNGPATSTFVPYPQGLAMDSAGSLYTGGGYSQLLKIDPSGMLTVLNPNTQTWFVSAPGPLSKAVVPGVEYLAFDGVGNLYFSDNYAGYLWEVTTGGTIQVVAGKAPTFALGDGGPASLASLSNPGQLWFTPDGTLLVLDSGHNRIRAISPAGTITTVAGDGVESYTNPGAALSISLYFGGGYYALTADPFGDIFTNTNNIFEISAGVGSQFYQSGYYLPGLAADAQGNVYAASSDNTIIKVTPAGGSTIVAGTGLAGFSGDNGPATSAQLNNPEALALDSAGNIYISDNGNTRIRKVTPDGIISTVAGGAQSEIDGVKGTLSYVAYPRALACDAAGNLYIVETYSQKVRMLSTSGIISTVAGNSTPGFSGDGGLATAANLGWPAGVAVDSSGNIFISDSLSNRIREVLAAPPALNVSTTQVTISAASLSAPIQTNINISGSIQNLQYTVQFSTKNGGNWLGFSSLQGTAPGVLSIITDPSALQPNTYQGTITIVNPKATPPTQVIAVTFEVTTQVPPSMAVGSGPLYFALAAGATAATAQLTISNQGGGTLSFSASAASATGGSWLQISPGSGTATASAPASLTVTATPGSLAVGTYTGSITVTSGTTGQTVTLPVTLAINPALQQIVLSQTGLTFTAVSQGGSVIPQSFGIFNAGSGSMTWNATVKTLSGSGWLSLSSTVGTVAHPFVDVSFVDVSVNAQGLPAGQYFGSVQVTANGASNSPQTVLIVLDVLPVGSNPGPQVLPSGLVFTASANGANPGSQTVTIANTTSNPVVYGSGITYVNASNWVTYLPANASVTPDTPAQITVQPNFAGLPAGVYRAVLTLAFGDGSVRTVSILAVLAPAGTVPAVRGEAAPKATTCKPSKLLPIFTQVGTGPSVSTGYPVAIVTDVVDDCGNPMNSGSVTLSFTDGDPVLSMINLQNGEWSGTWQPRNSNPAGVTVSLLAQESALTGTIQTLVGFQGAQTLPVASAVMNAVTLTQGPLAPGELVLIKGSGLADTQVAATTTPLLQQLGGAQVLMGGGLANLLYVDAGQMIGQVPFTVPVNTSQQIVLERDATLGVPSSVIVAAAQPAVFTADGSGLGQGLVYNATANGAAGNLANSSNPAQPGSTVVIYCAGLGAIDSQGNTSNPLLVLIGGVAAQVEYAGAAIPANYPSNGAPAILGLVSASLGGLYQINVLVPAGVASGPAAVIISVAGQSSPQGVTMGIAVGTTGPVPVPLGVVNAASFAKSASGAGSAVAPGSLIQIYTSLAGATEASAASAPFLTSLGGVSVTFDGIPAPIQAVVPTGAYPFINAQLPFEITNSSSSMVVTVNGVSSAPFAVPVTPQAPGIFTSPANGQSNAIFVYLNPATNAATVAAPSSQGSYFTIPVAPIPRGASGFFYATGIGALTPAVADGSGGGGVTSNANLMPTALVGGVPAQVGFAGQAPGYPGVNQINITIPANAPTGNAVSLQVMSGDGRVLSAAGATIAIQ
jgi:uncharacterized protein (TIGR03437 family)